MPYADITPPPGLNKIGSRYTARNQWFNGNLVRFFNGVPEKLGGWTNWITLSTGAFDNSSVRSLYLYRANDNTRYTGIGTTSRYAIVEGTVPSDITPVTALVFGNNPIASTNTQNTYTFTTTTPHGLSSGDLVKLSGITGTIGGQNLTYFNSDATDSFSTIEVTSTPSTTTFKLTGNVTANATTAGGGASVTGYAYLDVGSNSYSAGTGWGAGDWGGLIDNTAWGSTAAIDYKNQLRLWSEDNFGDDLIINPRGGPIYYWDKSGGTSNRAELISTKSQTMPPIISTDIASTTSSGTVSSTATTINVASTDGFYLANGYLLIGSEVIYYANTTATAFTGCVRGKNNTKAATYNSGVTIKQYESQAPFFSLQVLTSDQDGHVISFGCNPYLQDDINPMHIRWSDTQNAIDWTPRATNSAGGVDLSSGSEIVGALSGRQEILIWTDKAMYSMRYIGGELVFSFTEIQDGITMISPKAASNAGSSTYFMGERGFYKYTGAVEPIPCPVQNYIFDDLDVSEQQKIFSVANPRYNEVWWFYPSNEMNSTYAGSGTANPDLVQSADMSDPTRCVIYNYVENTWTLSDMWRSAGATAYEEDYMLLAQQFDTNNIFLVKQDDGDRANSLYADPFGTEFTSYIESGSIPIGDGDQFIALKSLIHDMEIGGLSNVSAKLSVANYPSESPTASSTNNVTNSTTKVDVRARGRSAILRYEHTDQDSFFKLYGIRADMHPDGKR